MLQLLPFFRREVSPDRKEARRIRLITNFGDITGEQKSRNRVQCNIRKVEERGITLRQLRTLYMHVVIRCKQEKWTNFRGELLSPETVTLYDINKYVIRPFTEGTQKSYVEMIARKPQKPRWFVSHYWGEPLKDFIACLEQQCNDFRGGNIEEGGGMDDRTPVWVCAYANNQWELDKSISDDPADSAFAKAMAISKGTISILDKDGIVFSRVWCIYELHRTMIDAASSSKMRYCVYTAHKHRFDYAMDILPWWIKWIPCISIPLRFILSGKQIRYDERDRKAVGLCPGGAPCDKIGTHARANREKYFPFHLIKSSIQVQVENAAASVDSDRVHILNAIVGQTNLNKEPPKSHPNYTSLNETLIANFAASEGVLQSALQAGGDEWEAVLKAMSKGQPILNEMTFNFEKGLGWDGMTTDQAVQMIHHLPLSVAEMQISHAPFGPAFISALADWIELSIGLKKVSIGHTYGGWKAGALLARAISTNPTIEWISLYKTDLMSLQNASHWSEAIAKTNTLKTICTTAKVSKRHPSSDTESRDSVLNAAQVDCEASVELHNADSTDTGPIKEGKLTGEGLLIICKGLSSNESIERFYIENHDLSRKDLKAMIPFLKKKSLKKFQFWEGGMGNITWIFAILRLRMAFICVGPSITYASWKHFHAAWSPEVVKEVRRNFCRSLPLIILVAWIVFVYVTNPKSLGILAVLVLLYSPLFLFYYFVKIYRGY